MPFFFVFYSNKLNWYKKEEKSRVNVSILELKTLLLNLIKTAVSYVPQNLETLNITEF